MIIVDYVKTNPNVSSWYDQDTEDSENTGSGFFEFNFVKEFQRQSRPNGYNGPYGLRDQIDKGACVKGVKTTGKRIKRKQKRTNELWLTPNFFDLQRPQIFPITS